jgi:stage II sporulation protein D
MRRLVILLVLAAALALPGGALAQAIFVINGYGFGHGIGMAQYGSYGFAQNGWTYDQILAHYYPGTQLGPASTSTIRVLLAAGRKGLDIASDSPFTVRDAQGLTATLPAGSVHVGTDLVVQVDGEARMLAPPVRFAPGKSPLRLGRPYRGTIVVSLVGGKLQAVNRLGLERYLYGVVAGEMPSSWHPEALEVQAVAARSYALASKKTGGSFDVYADTRSQVYGGLQAESPSTNAAVDATRGQVVLYQGKVAWTFFSSSSGGKTAAIQDVWPDAEPLPYLVSVDDPYDTISPYHEWGPLTFTAEEIAAKLGSRAPAGLTDLEVTLNGSGRVAAVTAVGTGGQTELSGTEMRTLLGLRSTWFTIDAMTLEPSARKIVYGQKVRLSGVARGTKQVSVERRPAGGGWALLERLQPSADGTFGTAHEPKVTTLFRLRLAGLVGPPVRVTVAPEVTLRKKAGGAALTGSVTPARAGIEVSIQRKSASAWQTVTTVSTSENGMFRVDTAFAAGVYRAWVAPAAGLVAGASAPLTVGGA